MTKKIYFFITAFGLLILPIPTVASNYEISFFVWTLWAATFIGFLLRNTIGLAIAKTSIGTIIGFVAFSYKQWSQLEYITLILAVIIYGLFFLPQVKLFCINSSKLDEYKITFSIPMSHTLVVTVSNLLSGYFLAQIGLLNNFEVSKAIFFICASAVFYFSMMLLRAFLDRMIVFVPRGIVLIDKLYFRSVIRVEKGELDFVSLDKKEEVSERLDKDIKNLTLGCKKRSYVLNIRNALVEHKTDTEISKFLISVDAQIKDLI